MKFKFSVFNLIICVAFVLAFVFILLSYLTPFMYIPATVMFCVAFVMLSIRLIQNYIKQTGITQEKEDAIIMELAMGEDGEKYVMQDAKKQKKLAKQQRRQNFDRLLPSIVSVAFSCLFVYLLVSSIINLF